MGVYPFMFGAAKDFQPIVDELAKVQSQWMALPPKSELTDLQQDFREPYDWDAYAPMYFPKAEELTKIAEEAEKAGEKEKASEYYLYGFSHPAPPNCRNRTPD